MEKRSTKSLTQIVTLLIVVIVVVVVALVVANRKSNNGSLSSAQTTAAKQEIETNWKTFFAASTSLNNREQLLQNGSKFTQPIQSEFTALGAQHSSASISSVNLTNSTSANLTYTVDLNNQPVLDNEKGEALLINKTWVVSDTTICNLLSMGGDHPSACQGVK